MQFHWSDSDLRNQNDGCESLAPFVMALFDGEASEDQAKRARAHLLVCQTCAHRWLDWNRSRDLLRTVTVPAPPPTLLWRVLMACRLAGFARKTTSTPTSAPAPRPSFGNSFGDSDAPDALRAQILARTTRAAASAETVSSSVVKSRSTFPGLAMPAFAVPALAMWLMVLQRDTLFETVASRPESFESAPTTRKRAAATPRRTPLLKKVSQPRSVTEPVEARIADGRDEDDAPEVRNQEERAKREQNVEHFARRDEHEGRLIRVGTPRSEDEPSLRLSRGFEVRLASLETTPAPRPVVEAEERELTVAPRQLPTAAVRPATLSDKTKLPRLRAAHWELATPRLARQIDTATNQAQAMRVSLPASRTLAAPARMTTPAPPTRLLSDSIDGDDERVDEVRSVVDDFRATLQPDSGAETDYDDITS
jgi:hypothetical protein